MQFYEDNDQTLSSIVNLFFREKKISISQQLVNLITTRARGDRQNLKNELQKRSPFYSLANHTILVDDKSTDEVLREVNSLISTF